MREPLDPKQEKLMFQCTPILSRRFDLALHLASGLHREQRRKGTSIPYIAHLMAVCAIVLENGGDEEPGPEQGEYRITIQT